MRHFPLLDLASAYEDAVYHLKELQGLANDLYDESEQTWDEMTRVHDQVSAALAALGMLPPGIEDGIAKDEADLAEMEDRADASRY